MRYLKLLQQIKQNIFSFSDVEKYFSEESSYTLRVQLSRFAKRGVIKPIKRGLYCFNPAEIDELELANLLYKPSYISLETALNYYGIMPDFPQAVTSVSAVTSKRIKNDFGTFYYSKIKRQLYFGFVKVALPRSNRFIQISKKEKALLDYFYIRKIKSIQDLRLDLQGLSLNRYKEYAKNFPLWVQKIKIKK